MSVRHFRIALASAVVIFAASACSSATGPSDTADLDEAGIMSVEEHQGSDSIRAADTTPMQVEEHQGSDS